MIERAHAELLAGWVVDGLTLEVITERANRAYLYGELPGTPVVVVQDDRGNATVRSTRYSKDEIAAMLESDAVKRQAELIRAERAEIAAELEAEAEAERQEHAKLQAQRDHEASVVPDLAARVEKLEAVLRGLGHEV